MIKLSMPPMDLYTIGCTTEPPFIWYTQKCMLYGKFDSILVLSFRSVRQKLRRAMLHATNSRKRCPRAWIFPTRTILSHTMTEL